MIESSDLSRRWKWTSYFRTFFAQLFQDATRIFIDGYSLVWNVSVSTSIGSNGQLNVVRASFGGLSTFDVRRSAIVLASCPSEEVIYPVANFIRTVNWMSISRDVFTRPVSARLIFTDCLEIHREWRRSDADDQRIVECTLSETIFRVASRALIYLTLTKVSSNVSFPIDFLQLGHHDLR